MAGLLPAPRKWPKAEQGEAVWAKWFWGKKQLSGNTYSAHFFYLLIFIQICQILLVLSSCVMKYNFLKHKAASQMSNTM